MKKIIKILVLTLMLMVITSCGRTQYAKVEKSIPKGYTNNDMGYFQVALPNDIEMKFENDIRFSFNNESFGDDIYVTAILLEGSFSGTDIDDIRDIFSAIFGKKYPEKYDFKKHISKYKVPYYEFEAESDRDLLITTKACLFVNTEARCLLSFQIDYKNGASDKADELYNQFIDNISKNMEESNIYRINKLKGAVDSYIYYKDKSDNYFDSHSIFDDDIGSDYSDAFSKELEAEETAESLLEDVKKIEIDSLSDEEYERYKEVIEYADKYL